MLQDVGTSRVRAVAFDLDGTLVDSCADIARATNHCLEEAGLPLRTQSEVRGYIGDGSRRLLERAAGFAPGDERVEPLLERFFVHYVASAVVDTKPLTAALPVLDALSHLPLALCTNKPRVATDAVLTGLGLAGRFSVVVAAGDVEHTKPHPEPLERVATLLGLAPAELALVGDGPQDVRCAKAAGARSIGITDAVIVPLEKLRAEGPDALVPLADVPTVIRAWNDAGG